MTKQLIFIFLISSFLFSCGPSDEQIKQREQAIADSIAKMLTGKPMSDSSNIKRAEELKQNPKVEAVKADATSLKNIGLEYDYDNKPFNKKSDVDGKLYNRSGKTTYKNVQLKVVCKDKNGNTTKSFSHFVYTVLNPGSSDKFTIRFEDDDKSKTAMVTIVGADEVLK